LHAARETVARERDFLLPAPTIREESRAEADDRDRQAVVEAVDRAVLKRRQPQMQEQVDRQQAVDHLGRDVGQETREPERQDHGARRGESRARRRRGLELPLLEPVEAIHRMCIVGEGPPFGKGADRGQRHNAGIIPRNRSFASEPRQ
jgi:hypothetical protein